MDIEHFSSNPDLEDAAAVAYYEKILNKLSEAALKIPACSDVDIKVSISGTLCVLSAKQLGQHIKHQSMFFERLLQQALDRLDRNKQEEQTI